MGCLWLSGPWRAAVDLCMAFSIQSTSVFTKEGRSVDRLYFHCENIYSILESTIGWKRYFTDFTNTLVVTSDTNHREEATPVDEYFWLRSIAISQNISRYKIASTLYSFGPLYQRVWHLMLVVVVYWQILYIGLLDSSVEYNFAAVI